MTEEMKKAMRENIHKAVDMVLDANGFESRKRETTGTLPTVFFNFSGHVNALYIQIHKDGWKSGENADRTWNIDLDKGFKEETLDSIRHELDDALKDVKEKELETLLRDIEKKQETIKEQRRELANLKRTLKEKEKKVSA